MDELQSVVERQVRQFASCVLGHPKGTSLDRAAEADLSLRLRGHERGSYVKFGLIAEG
jgi:hypothetical protein